MDINFEDIRNRIHDGINKGYEEFSILPGLTPNIGYSTRPVVIMPKYNSIEDLSAKISMGFISSTDKAVYVYTQPIEISQHFRVRNLFKDTYTLEQAEKTGMIEYEGRDIARKEFASIVEKMEQISKNFKQVSDFNDELLEEIKKEILITDYHFNLLVPNRIFEGVFSDKIIRSDLIRDYFLAGCKKTPYYRGYYCGVNVLTCPSDIDYAIFYVPQLLNVSTTYLDYSYDERYIPSILEIKKSLTLRPELDESLVVIQFE